MREFEEVPLPIINPLGVIGAEQLEIAPRLNTLEGKTIGLLDAHKEGSDVVLRIVKEFLSKKGVKEFKYRIKPSSPLPSPQELIEDVSHTDAVVAAFGD